MANEVTSDFILEGAMYALEQCGHLLHAALTLYHSDSYPTAVAVAGLAREELGRYRILRDEWIEVSQRGKPVTLKEIQNACYDHLKKQQAGLGATVLRITSEDSTSQIYRTIFERPQDSPEYQQAQQQLATLRKAKRRRMPTERHDQRMRALYVDPNDAGTDWNRPCQIDKASALHSMTDLANDYSAEITNVEPWVLTWESSDLHPDLLQFARAVKAWNQRPSLPARRWPSWGPVSGR